jgi:hypothetical protein
MYRQNINIKTKCGQQTGKALSNHESFSPSQFHETVPLTNLPTPGIYKHMPASGRKSVGSECVLLKSSKTMGSVVVFAPYAPCLHRPASWTRCAGFYSFLFFIISPCQSMWNLAPFQLFFISIFRIKITTKNSHHFAPGF